MAIIYRANGECEEVQPENGKDFKLEQLRAIVGGFIEVLSINDDEIMVLNEEGKLLELDYNHEATRLYCNRYRTNDYIVGDVLICNNNEIK